MSYRFFTEGEAKELCCCVGEALVRKIDAAMALMPGVECSQYTALPEEFHVEINGCESVPTSEGEPLSAPTPDEVDTPLEEELLSDTPVETT